MPNKKASAISITRGELADLEANMNHAKRLEIGDAVRKRNEAVVQSYGNYIRIPVPSVAPLGIELNKRAQVQEVWDTFIKPNQEAGNIQSAEERMLMAILRAVYMGMAE